VARHRRTSGVRQISSRVAPVHCPALLLPLLHTRVEERAGERRLCTSLTKPLSPALSPQAGRESRPRREAYIASYSGKTKNGEQLVISVMRRQGWEGGQPSARRRPFAVEATSDYLRARRAEDCPPYHSRRMTARAPQSLATFGGARPSQPAQRASTMLFSLLQPSASRRRNLSAETGPPVG
jgi:hypothetical protein